MDVRRGSRIESLEHLQERQAEHLAEEEEEGDAALDSLIDEMAEREFPESEPEAGGRRQGEFACRSCHLIFSRACIGNVRLMLCTDCVKLAEAGPEGLRREGHTHLMGNPREAVADDGVELRVVRGDRSDPTGRR